MPKLPFDEQQAMIRLDIETTLTASQKPTRFALPCPAGPLLDLAVVMSDVSSDGNVVDDRAGPAGGRSGNLSDSVRLRLHHQLRTNPTLLLFALHSFWSGRATAARDADQLIDWCLGNLLAKFQDQALGPMTLLAGAEFDDASAGTFDQGWSGRVILGKKDRRVLRDFLRARGYKKTFASLSAWLKRQAGLPKRYRNDWLEQVLARTFRMDGFRVAESGAEVVGKATLKRQIAAWQASPVGESRVKQIFAVVGQSVTLHSRFQRKLELEKHAAMKELAYGASHEINNPLANIATRAQTALTEENHPVKRQRLSTIYQQAMRAHEMISDMMLFAHPPQSVLQSVCVRRLLRKFIGCWERGLSLGDGVVQADSELRVFLAPGVNGVLADADQFLVVIGLLVRNACEAIQATERTGEILVRVDPVVGQSKNLPYSLQASTRASWLQVSVWDNGIGVDDRIRRHLFDPFFSGREAGRGLGFGLPKAWRIIEQHGGEILIDDRCDLVRDLYFGCRATGSFDLRAARGTVLWVTVLRTLFFKTLFLERCSLRRLADRR